MSAPALAVIWKTESLGKVVEILDSRRIPVNSKERAKRVGDVPYYGATGQVGCIDSHIFDEELVLLGEDGAPFLDSAKPKAYLIRGKSWVNNHAHVLRGKPGLLNSFLLYQLNCVDYRPYVSGTTRLKLPQGSMKQIPLLVPREDEQRRIVAEIEKQFTRLEAGVAGLRRVQANLKRYRAAVLKAACEGKLVPTEAEIARKSGRSYETGAELLVRMLTERRQKWTGRGKYKEPAAPDASNLPPLPEGWTWATVEQVSTLVQYGSSAKTNEDSTGVPVLRMGNIEEGKLALDALKYLPMRHDEFPDLLLTKGDLLFNRTNSAELVGKTAVYKGTPHPCSLASYLIRVRLAECCLPEFVAYFINSVFGRAWIAKVVSQQVGQANVNGTKLQALAIPLPPLAEQQRIVAEVERRLSVVEELEAVVTANLQRATRLRQSILKQAFCGALVSSHRDTTEGAESVRA